MNTDDILRERGLRYGAFVSQADLSQKFKDVLIYGGSIDSMQSYQKEALEMILHKIARVANGDPNYTDSWKDIAGYAQLVVDILEGRGR